MVLDRDAQAVLDEIERDGEGEREPQTREERIARARRDAAGLSRFSAPAPSGVARRDLSVPGRGGPIPVRLYEPAARVPLLVWFHGGGTIAGSLDTHEPVLMKLAEKAGHAVASVGYTLAPEAVYPRQHEECLAATRWLALERHALGLDPGPWALGGDSVGGLYAAATAIALRREAFDPMPAAQVLVYPNTDLGDARAYPSLRENEGRIMTLASLRFEAETAVPRAADRAGPRASPLREADLAGLPPAFLASAEADPLRDEGESFAERLAAAGTPVRHKRFAGMIHAFLQMNGRIPAAGDLMDDIASFLHAKA